MSYLPISINVENKKLLIIGGGKVALQKANNILPFSKNITVVAPDIISELQLNENIQTIFDSYDKKHLEGVFLVYACSDSEKVNRQVFSDAESLGILCNRADKAEESHFHSSSIIETNDMVVAINSKKKEVKRTIALRNELQAYLNEKESLLNQKNNLKGKVFLVGFGPGNPDLLTRRGDQLLHQADVIFYDDLLDADALAKYPGEKVYVGKRRDNHSKEQGEINEILCRAAKKGNMVVRLKGGDPLIFGRGSEERIYLEEQGIQVEIIPGISSAIAAAAYGDVPLTHRGISSSVAFSTAHGKNSFEILESDTSVYYMGAKNIKQIAQKYLDKGYTEDFPAALIRYASMPYQEVVKTTIKEIAEGNIEIQSPIISIFGYTVNYKSIAKELKLGKLISQ